MKKTIIILAVTAAFMAEAVFSGCQSADQKIAEAKEKVQDANQDLKLEQNKANTAAQKTANAEAWKALKSEWEAAIKSNEIIIADLKAEIKKPGKIFDGMFEKSINELEQKNKEMKIRIDAYDKSQSDWESFKREFTHDMDGIGTALKNLTVNNKR